MTRQEIIKMNNNIISIVNRVIRTQGGYREKDILNHSHVYEKGETWNAAHKVVNILSTTPAPDGYRAGCAVDIVTRSIVG